MSRIINKILSLSLLIVLLSIPAISASDVVGETSVSAVFSELLFSADPFVTVIGYTVNGESGVERLVVSGGDVIDIQLNYLPPGASLQTTLENSGMSYVMTDHPLTLHVVPHTAPKSITVHLALIGYVPPTPVIPPGGGLDVPTVTPSLPDTPILPTGPDVPEHPDTPGSDEPLVPILPPAGSVYNLAGFIPLGAGALLLFLVFFWKRKVYRILKSHAKKHGEKPEKEHLKEIADAIIKLVRDEGRYPEWKKNSDVAKRLSADIVSVLDEMNYPKIVPRGALVAEIIKAARGRINRHRL